MIDDSKILIIGGSGLLGSELIKLYPKCYAPTHKQFDIVTKYHPKNFFTGQSIDLIIHCAVSKSQDRLLAAKVNIKGTQHVVEIANAIKAKLVYISTDYVFDGYASLCGTNHGIKPYNYYGETKLAGEYCVKALPQEQYLILRGSFSPDQWPFDNAYINHVTSKLPVSKFANRVAYAIQQNYSGIQHIANERQSIYSYACRNNPLKKGIKPSQDKTIISHPYYLDFSLQDTVI